MKDKIIKINFCDFWRGFVIENSLLYKILQKKYDIEITNDKPDFIFYSCFGNKNTSYTGCTKIFVTGENLVPNFNKCDYAISPNYITFDNRHFRFPMYYYNEQLRIKHLNSPENRKFCNFVYRNYTLGTGALLRQKFCQKLSSYKHIDCPSSVLNNMDKILPPRRNWWFDEGKIRFLSDYKFTIAFENTIGNGYTTEKLTDAFMASSIPIYWGNPLVCKEFNPKAFINCNDFDSLDSVIEYIKLLDNDKQLYIEMLNQPPLLFNPEERMQQFEKFLYSIIERGNNPFEKDIVNREKIMYHT